MEYFVSMECPNCITPWKCNGPHLDMVNDSIYKSDCGHFMKNNLDEWSWLPNDKEYNFDTLLTIMDTLQNLNEKKYD